MRTVTTSRRTVLASALAAAASVAAACGRAAQPRRSATASSAPAPRTPSVTTPSQSPRRSTPAANGGEAVQVTHGPRTRNAVALTFHGAGDPAIARELLAIFAAHRARVTVLAVGTWLEQYPDIAPAIAAAGHELGNHTYRHLDIDSLDAATARREIVRCRDLLRGQVGSAGVHFRPSQAHLATPLVRRLAGAAGYPVCLSYDVDSLDYTDPGPDAVRANVATARPGSVISMHFGHEGTVQAMPSILRDLQARNLRPVTAVELLGP
jgi:peptidoglycan/xylan/chitin deacetylase (PgdA/CDA1 family)